MRIPQVIFPAGPNHGSSKTKGESSFKINTWPMERKIRHEKLTQPDFGNQLVTYFFVVMNFVNSDWIQFAVLTQRRFDSLLPRFIQRMIKRHRYKASPRNSRVRVSLQLLPPPCSHKVSVRVGVKLQKTHLLKLVAQVCDLIAMCGIKQSDVFV